MRDLLAASLPLLPATLGPLVLLLLAPLCGRRVRTACAVVLLLGALVFVADVLVLDHDHVRTLAVTNGFPRADQPGPHRWTVAVESAPAWHYHVVIALALGLPALLLLARRNRPPGAPDPALYGAGLGGMWLGLRLALEKTAAPEPLVFATGLNFALLVILPFAGCYGGLRGLSFRRFVGRLLLMAGLQRGALIAFAYWATVHAQGTHLDTHVVTDMAFGPLGEVRFKGDATRAWIWTTLIPHSTMWIAVTVIAGIVLGAVPYAIARRRAVRAHGTLPPGERPAVPDR